MKHLLLCFCLFFIATAGYGQIYYVSETGDDADDGSQNFPFQTISFAIAQANAGDEDEASVFIFPGAYTDSTVTIMRPMSIGRAPEDESTDTVAITLQPDATILFDINDSSGLVFINNLALLGNANATGIVVSNSDNLNITDNTFKNFAQAIRFDNSNFSEIEVERNTFQTSTTDIVIGPTVTNLNALRIFSNQFDYPAGGNVSINNQTNSVVNAEYNWWGAAAADSVEKAVSNNVDYSPWLNTNNNVAIGNGFEGDETSVRIDQDSPSATGDENNLQTAYATAQKDATLILTNSDQPYPSLVADSLSITLASEAPTGTIAVDTLVIELADPLDSVALSNGLLLINDSLALLSGNLQTLDSSQVILGESTGDINESNGRLVGNFTASRLIDQGTFRALGVDIGRGSEDIGQVKVTRVTGPDGIVSNTTEDTTYTSAAVTWTIETEKPSDQRNLKFTWYESFDNGIDPVSTIVYKLDENQKWVPTSSELDATSSSSTGNNPFRTASLVDTLSLLSTWTVSDINSPLPVILTSFTAYQEESTVYLSWSTASEINSDYFQVERSLDGSDFQSLSRQPAAGDSQQELTYRYTDEGAANRFSGTLYYRLKMVDFDGSFEYSDITAVALNQRPGLRVHADRARGEIKLFSDWKETRYTVQVADMLGRVLLKAPLQISEEQNYTFSFSSLPPAVYVLRCIGVLDVQTSKFKVE